LSFRHPRAKDEKNPSQKLLELAMRNKDEGFSAGFNEPTVNFDYPLDPPDISRNKRFVSNTGYEWLPDA
jgi:pyruvate formate lyase activating enzyme